MSYTLDPEIPEQREILRRLFLVKKTEVEMMAARGFQLNAVLMMKITGTRSKANQITFTPADLSWMLDPLLGLQTKLSPELSPEFLTRESSLSTQSMDEQDLADIEGPDFKHFLEYRAKTNLFQHRLEFSSIYKSGSETVLVLYLLNKPGKKTSLDDYKIVDFFIQKKPLKQIADFKHIILITNTGLNSPAKKKIAERTLGYTFEVFLDLELAFPRIKHAYAPISVDYIPRDKVSQWAQEEQLQPNKLPMQLDLDPVSKWFGAKPYDVFQTELMGTSVDTFGYARIVRQTVFKS